jgi:hypothetical protein
MAAGDGLYLATAGTAAQFTIQANDQYDNERGEVASRAHRPTACDS